MIRLFLVDDHTIMREGLRALLTAEPQLEVVGEAGDGEELLAKLPTVAADVVLLDLHMPGLDGLATTLQLHQQYPNLRILVLSMVTHARSIGQLFEAGAHGYLLKTTDTREIAVAVHTVMAGKPFMCSQMGLALLGKVLSEETAKLVAGGKSSMDLTERELDILLLIGNGLTNQEIADKLFISRRTVETHRQSLLEKTGARNTPALIKYAMEQHLLGAD